MFTGREVDGNQGRTRPKVTNRERQSLMKRFGRRLWRSLLDKYELKTTDFIHISANIFINFIYTLSPLGGNLYGFIISK